MTPMATWHDFVVLSIGLTSWSPSIFSRIIGGKIRKLDYSTIYVLTVAFLAIVSLLFSSVFNLLVAHKMYVNILGFVCAVLGSFITSRLDRYIIRKFHGLTVRSSLQHEFEVAPSSNMVKLSRLRIAQSIRAMPLWQLILIGIGEEAIFRVGVPIGSTRGTIVWILLSFFGTLLFVYSHLIFGRGQVLSKVPLAIFSLILFLCWGVWSCMVCHACYNAIYWRNQRKDATKTGLK